MKFFGRGNNNNGQNNNGEKNQPSPSNSPVSPNRQGPPSQRTVDENIVKQLCEMFPSLDISIIHNCVRDNNNNFDRSLDTLLNIKEISEHDSLQPIPLFLSQQNSVQQSFPKTLSQAQQTKTTSQQVKTSPQQPSKLSDNRNIDDQVRQACKEGNAGLVSHFMKEIKPHLRRDISSLLGSCLLEAIEGGFSPIVKLLLDNGAPVNGNPAEKNLPTPLMLAIEKQRLDIIYLLINNKADLNRTNSSQTPLHYAVKFSLDQVVKTLIENKVLLDRVDTLTGETALHLAVRNQNYDLVNKLLDSGASLIYMDNHGDTPLHVSVKACCTSHETMITLVLLEKAKGNSQVLNFQNSKTGETILHIAVDRFLKKSYPNVGLIELILRYKPDKNIRNKNGKTAYDLAREKQTEIAIPPNILSLLSPDSSPERIFDEEIHPFSVNSHTSESILQHRRSIRQTSEPNNKVRKGNDPDWQLVYNFRMQIEDLLENNGFEKEYLEIEELTKSDVKIGNCSAALTFMYKNRYKNILPFEETRVKLTPINGIEDSHYINANYISGEVPGSEKLYIATQGPLPHTCDDLWRMIWEQNSKVVVMLANEIENGRQKVYPYWPDQEPLRFATFQISLVSFKKESQVLHREIKIFDLATKRERIVWQFQFIGWPDQGLPEDATGFTYLIDLVNGKNFDNSPIVVHCSAGIGRTGTFCIVHTTLAKLDLLLTTSNRNFKFNLKESVIKMRKQRCGIVQTLEQYIFCYLSLIDRLIDVLQVLDYKNSAWFHKNLTQDGANKVLKNKPEGTYLFRPTNEVGYIIASAKKGSQICDFRVAVTPKGFVLDTQTFHSLVALVENRKAFFLNPLMNDEI